MPACATAPRISKFLARRARYGAISAAPARWRLRKACRFDNAVGVSFSALAFRDVREEAVQSIHRYFTEQLDERIGNIQAGALLSFFLEEIGPVVYNPAVREAQERLQTRVAELDYECHQEPFQYWKKFDKRR
ncbi:Uncharacterized conserved protein [Ralstonia pickettii]|jgi:uncharacterized protein (DUF2164 family)|nr:hypothetical protein HMPREF0989_00227 [Ralstonia sp. 5_2_56FAA]KFL23192.1 hypothetical protein DP23_2636 [Ralstonia pickettii]MBU6524756.1 DUF2164 domain-containing protein [Ralstonia sp. B265]NPT48309.1 DUF2164 family protein [Ralstonia sp. 3N]SCW28982.1 Uncharacterized conserved protein, DUF2164 family [Ralstonia sp. UNCCL144]